MSFPGFGTEFNEWMKQEKFIKVTKEVEDYELVESGNTVEFTGLFVPMSAQKVALKPEGQRTWRWWTLITSQELSMDDVVINKEVEYRVFGKEDYFEHIHHYNYELAEAFHEV